ncbi:MAG: hypothetical protein QOG64_2223, partial [Acidimicrobiaceae bacterium]|nr:hypothetical protein [Acidimicrobiaceae bacterium]
MKRWRRSYLLAVVVTLALVA